jgi:hypothetical protein
VNGIEVNSHSPGSSADALPSSSMSSSWDIGRRLALADFVEDEVLRGFLDSCSASVSISNSSQQAFKVKINENIPYILPFSLHIRFR